MTTIPTSIETGDWKAQAVDQLEYHWSAQIRKRWDGLTDEEYLWEPVAGCWSVKRRGEATSKMADGQGDFVVDFEWPPPQPEPVTTIAWRLVHITAGCFGNRTASHFGDRFPEIRERFGGEWWTTYEIPGTADQALADLDEVHAAWVDGIRSLSDDDMWRPVGPAEGPWTEHPFLALVLHINREVIHHGAEISLLRDLYRARS
jgi:hypothetical protein